MLNPEEMTNDEIQEELAARSEHDDPDYGRIGLLEAELVIRQDVFWAKKEIARD